MATSGNLTVSEWVTLFVMILTLLVGFLGNLLVIFIVVKKNRNQTPQDVFIFNLAVADFVFGNLTIVPNIVKFFGLHQPSSYVFYCSCVYPTLSVCFIAAMFHITSMAVWRCRVITNPWQSRNMTRQGRKVAIVWTLFNWLLALILILPLIIVVQPTLDCSESWPTEHHRKAYTVSLVALQYVLPLLITAGCYVKMGLYLWRSRIQRVEVDSLGAVVRRNNRNQNKEIIKTLTAIVVTFALLIFPLQLCWLLSDFGNFKDQDWFKALRNVSNSLTMIQSSLNPIIYGTVSKRFRREYVACLTNLCTKKRTVPSASQPPPQLPRAGQLKIAENGDEGMAHEQSARPASRPPVILAFQELQCP